MRTALFVMFLLCAGQAFATEYRIGETHMAQTYGCDRLDQINSIVDMHATKGREYAAIQARLWSMEKNDIGEPSCGAFKSQLTLVKHHRRVVLDGTPSNIVEVTAKDGRTYFVLWADTVVADSGI